MINPEAAKLLASLYRSQEEAVVCQFNAGRCNYNPETKKVVSKPNRGKITIKKNLQERGMYDFQWSERNSNNVAFERSIFPNLASWKKCDDCKDGRVYILRISGGDPVFFWMQEVKEEKDKEVEEKLADVFKASGNGEAPQEVAANLEAQFMNMFGNNNTNNNNNNNNSQLQQQIQQQRELIENDPDLQDVFPSDRVGDILETVCFDTEAAEQLATHLPEELRSQADMLEHLQSAEFRSACSRLNTILRTPESSILWRDMNLNGSGMGVQAFLDAISDVYGPEDDDEDMEEN